MKKFFLIFLLFNFLTIQVYGLDLIDDSFNETIKSTQDVDKIKNDLPPLPSNNGYIPSTIITQTPYVAQQKYIIKKGTKFNVRLQTNLNDFTPENSIFYFQTTNTLPIRYLNVPAGTKMRGKVINSHPAWIGGNGGLLIIKADKLILDGISYDIEAEITAKNSKMVFFNKMKGKNTYIKNIGKKTAFGRRTYSTMWGYTKNLFSESPQFLLSPFPFTTGLFVLGANIVVSPVLAVFSKGERLTIPSGTYFTLKLSKDCVIYK